MTARRFGAGCALALPALFAACHGGPADPPLGEPLVVEVSPKSVAVLPCGAARLTAEVSGGEPMASRAVEWLSRDPGIVAVDATGLLASAGWGDTWILARAVADPGVADSAFATTRFTTPTLTIRIARITAGPDSVEVAPDSVAGTVDVALAVDGGTSCTELDRVELTIDGDVAGTRPAQAPPFTRVVPVDTRAQDPATGDPRWPDGPHELRAVLYRPNGEKAATPAVTLTFRNGGPP